MRVGDGKGWMRDGSGDVSGLWGEEQGGPRAGAREAGPTYWDDNYISLLPGETRILKAVVPKAELEGQDPTVRVLGWNVR